MDGMGLDMDRDFQAIYPENFVDGPYMVLESRAAAIWGSGLRWPGFVEIAGRPLGARFIVPNAEEIARIRGKYPFLDKLTVPAGLYPGQYDPLDTVGAWSFILARPDLDDSVGSPHGRRALQGRAHPARSPGYSRRPRRATRWQRSSRSTICSPASCAIYREIKLVK